MTLVILPTGTPHGITTALELAWGCGRKAQLKKIHQEESEIDDNPRRSKPSPTLTGTFGHALLENYFGQLLDGYEPPEIYDWIQETQVGGLAGPSLRQAARCFMFFRAQFQPDIFGRPIAIEEEISIEEEWGFLAPFTMRLDLATRITKKHVLNLAKHHCDVEPGIWLVDHKFLGNFSGHTYSKYAKDMQGQMYLRAYNYNQPKARQAKGLIYNIITKTTSPSFHQVVVREDPIADKILGNLTAACYSKGWPITEENNYACNPRECDAWFEECRFLTANLCKRF